MVDDLVSNKREGILCKLDMEKTYDHVNWKFMDYMLGRLIFGNKQRKWMNTCITTTSFAVMVNGWSSSFFKATKGLHQGDPLSLLLFIIVMEAFSRLLERAREVNLIKGVNVGRGDSRVEISHLFFANDTLISVNWGKNDASSLMHSLMLSGRIWIDY